MGASGTVLVSFVLASAPVRPAQLTEAGELCVGEGGSGAGGGCGGPGAGSAVTLSGLCQGTRAAAVSLVHNVTFLLVMFSCYFSYL